jgi:predicted DNA-binding transcriptional regulator AlpA
VPISLGVSLEQIPALHTSEPTTPDTGVQDEPLISPKQLAAWLSVSPNTMRQWVARGPEADLLPRMIRVNGQVRFRPADVRTWLSNNEM